MSTHFTEEFRISQRFSETFLERFWKYIEKTDSCWLWTGHTSWGYGKLGRGGRGGGEVKSHVASWLIHRGEIPEGLFVCHNCPGGDRRNCVNPDHLWLGTHDDNMRDMVAKGCSCIGEKNGCAILNSEAVLKIRQLHATTMPNQRALARLFRINFRTINYIVHRKLWAHI